ncbi:MAG TPA: alpha/beta hydrolase-fold protein [Pirellulaceae bacterium]|nr:alpha/beta hydrolase-fold protein [Pirellulaceae bacterium]
MKDSSVTSALHRAVCLLVLVCARPALAELRFDVSFDASVDPGPLTGRLLVIIAKEGSREPRLLASSFAGSTPFFGVDVAGLAPGQSATIDERALGYPVSSLKDLPAGDYSVQAVLNVYTQVRRKDGHTVWVHLDQWEGQQWNRSPGNLVSSVQRVRLDPAAGFAVRLALDKKLPAVEVPPDTEWVKRVKIQSHLLSEFWGCPIYLGATVLLPRGYNQDTEQKYPAIYVQGHFNLRPPLGFAPPGMAFGRGPEFYRAWTSDDFPRMVAVTFQHPTPYYDDSYAVNSANNGPYGDALTQELIPYLEQKYRLLPQPEARVLTGGSTGGWEALALQIFHPKFFSGVWSLYPDPVDFRRYQVGNVYEDANAFSVPRGDWARLERPLSRTIDGQVTQTMREMSQAEAVLGSNVRSGGQIAAWDAAYGPVGKDGYPRPLWDRLTGKIDKDVAAYMRDNGYDLRHYLEQNWTKLGPDLTGKIYVACGDEDTYYLNLAVYLLEDSLKLAKNPPASAIFEYGRLKGHGWQPFSNADLVRKMAERISATSPGLVTTR